MNEKHVVVNEDHKSVRGSVKNFLEILLFDLMKKIVTMNNRMKWSHIHRKHSSLVLRAYN